MNVTNFIQPELLVMIPILYIIGLGIKKSNIKDNYIPLILGGASICLCALWVAATIEISNWRDALYAIFATITQGILNAGASVYANQLCIQSKKKK